MLYKQNRQRELEDELFQNPTSEYRGTPFWSWNCKITKNLIDDQLEVFRKMGFGGAHLHPRTGMKTPYMSEEFLDYVRYTNDKSKELGLLTWLYDEDRYPSGAAGGIVTENMEYRARHLLLTREPKEGYCRERQEFIDQCDNNKKSKGYYVTAYQVLLQDSCLHSYKRLSAEEASAAKSKEPEGKLWFAYVKLQEESPWFNDQTYLDVLNQKAVKRFIEVTHEKYYDKVGGEFGESIPAIFTDEPHITGKMAHAFAESDSDITVSYTDDFDESFQKQYGIALLDVLPEILWELMDGKTSVHRYHYHIHLSERFVTAFCDTLGDWCRIHKIALTGHFLSERTLYSQTLALSEAMRCYRSFQLPGIDILCDQKELSTAKQAVSVARQYSREGVLSELYGVTQWDYDYKGHKLQGDWQAALGVTIRVPHLAYMSMEGEAKRDWPASISYQSPWYETYSFIENHFARLNTVLTRGKAVVKVGVIHPIESFWISYGPSDQTQIMRDQLDHNFEDLMQWLLYGMIDFDLISEALLPELCQMAGAPLMVGCMEYDAIILPDLKTIRSTTLDRLESFAAQGGNVIFAGRIPKLVDALESNRAEKLALETSRISFSREDLLTTLSEVRTVEVRCENGKLADNLFYQLRQDETCQWLFICHVNRKRNLIDIPENYLIKIKGEYEIVLYDTISGKKHIVMVEHSKGNTILRQELYGEDSILLQLVHGNKTAPLLLEEDKFLLHRDLLHSWRFLQELAIPGGFELTEPNVLLLDYAKYQLNDGPIQPRAEILRIDNEVRAKLNYPLRQDAYIQPWRFDDSNDRKDWVTLYYEFESSIEIDEARLALEQPDNVTIHLNGEEIKKEVTGYYVDSFLSVIRLPLIRRGRNQIVLSIPFTRKTNLEAIYILGSFGVDLKGPATVLTKAPDYIQLGDVTRQGLPFYTGNIRYEFKFEIESENQEIMVSIPHFASPVLAIYLDGNEQGLIAFAPHKLPLGKLCKGSHKLEIMSYGNRFNGFGTLHNCNDEYKWYGPDSYRTKGSQWSDCYGVRPVGILSRVELFERQAVK